MDMFLYRTRLLPTIYAANQYIYYQGININGRYEKSPHALIRPGDIFYFDDLS
jgi:ribosomal protein S4